MALDEQRFKDSCLIIVGDGGKADEVLAKRRLEAGGRLAHFLMRGAEDHRITHRGSDEEDESDFFTWQPPKANMGLSKFAQKLGAKPRTFWTKNGPDGIELAEHHRLLIRYGVTGKPRHVSVTDEKGNILVEMSGYVVVDPDMCTAETLQVDVHNTELNAFGTFSWRFVRLALLFQFLWQVAKFSLSINFELGVTEGEEKIPWFRNLLAALNWSLTGNIICIEMTCFALTGCRATMNSHAVGNLASTIGIMAVAPLHFSEFVLCFVGTASMVLVTPLLHFHNTLGIHSERRFLPHLLWSIAQLCGTAGCFILFGLIAQAYATLLSTGQALAATLFLPLGTAIAETGMVVFARIMYDRLVHSKKIGHEQCLVGDQLYIPAPCLIMSAHAFAEGCRLTATFSGAVSSGSWGWISTSILSVALNISARLGWSRFMLIQLGKKLCSGPKAMALFAPTGWSKYHDELKIYAGWFRFAPIISLCLARLLTSGVLSLDGPGAPAFNQSALVVVIALLVAELVEDLVVTKELLPINPAGPGLLKMNANGDNADPAQLISLEHLPNIPQNDPWRLSELEESGKLSIRRTSSFGSLGVTDAPTPSSIPQKVVSLASLETDQWSRLRKWFGQPRALNSSPSLHGLRELPFAVQFSFIGITAEFTLGLLALLLGAGYIRGTCDTVLVGPDRIMGLVFWGLRRCRACAWQRLHDAVPTVREIGAQNGPFPDNETPSIDLFARLMPLEAAQNGLQLMRSLGYIVPWTLIASIGTGMLLPMGNFLALNFFAQKYTDLPPSEIQCQISTSAQHCQLALIDGNRLLTVLAVAMPICQFLTLPLVGVLSDAYGRRKALIVVFLLSNVALVTADLFVFFNFSFWFTIAWQPFMNTQVCTTVLNAACVDLLKPQDRAAGMGIINALDTIAYVIGLLLGYHLQLKETYFVASCMTVLTALYAFLVFPETLPPEKRSWSNLKPSNFIPWDSMPILWRTSTLRNLSIVTAIAAFMDNSTNRMMGTYYQRKMDWSAQDSYSFEFYWDISMIVWMTCFFSIIVSHAGEVGAMAFGRLASTIYILVGVCLVRPTQAYINCSLCAGPMTFALPAVAGLKSRLVGEEEQGRMQAAIGTVFMVSGSLGSLLGGFMFEKLGNVDENGQFSKIDHLAHAMVAVNLLGAFVSAILFYDLFHRTKHFIISDARDTRRLSDEACPETSTYGAI